MEKGYNSVEKNNNQRANQLIQMPINWYCKLILELTGYLILEFCEILFHNGTPENQSKRKTGESHKVSLQFLSFSQRYSKHLARYSKI